MMQRIKNKMLLVVMLALSPVFMTLPSGSFLSRLFAPPSSLLTSIPVSAFKSVVFSQNSTFRDVVVLSALGFGFAPIAAAAPLLPVMAAAPFVKWVCLFSAVGRVAWSVDEGKKDIKATRKNTEELKKTTGEIDKKADTIKTAVIKTNAMVDAMCQNFALHKAEAEKSFTELNKNVKDTQVQTQQRFDKTQQRFDKTDAELYKLQTSLGTVNAEVKDANKKVAIVSGSVQQLTDKFEQESKDAKSRDANMQRKISDLHKQTQGLGENVSNLRTDFAVLNATVTQNDQKLHDKIENMEKKADGRHQEITKKLVEKTAVMNKLLDRHQEIQDEQLAIQEQLKELSKGQEKTQEGVEYLVSHAQRQEQEKASAINRKSSTLTALDFVNRNN